MASRLKCCCGARGNLIAAPSVCKTRHKIRVYHGVFKERQAVPSSFLLGSNHHHSGIKARRYTSLINASATEQERSNTPLQKDWGPSHELFQAVSQRLFVRSLLEGVASVDLLKQVTSGLACLLFPTLLLQLLSPLSSPQSVALSSVGISLIQAYGVFALCVGAPVAALLRASCRHEELRQPGFQQLLVTSAIVQGGQGILVAQQLLQELLTSPAGAPTWTPVAGWILLAAVGSTLGISAGYFTSFMEGFMPPDQQSRTALAEPQAAPTAAVPRSLTFLYSAGIAVAVGVTVTCLAVSQLPSTVDPHALSAPPFSPFWVADAGNTPLGFVPAVIGQAGQLVWRCMTWLGDSVGGSLIYRGSQLGKACTVANVATTIPGQVGVLLADGMIGLGSAWQLLLDGVAALLGQGVSGLGVLAGSFAMALQGRAASHIGWSAVVDQVLARHMLQQLALWGGLVISSAALLRDAAARGSLCSPLSQVLHQALGRTCLLLTLVLGQAAAPWGPVAPVGPSAGALLLLGIAAALSVLQHESAALDARLIDSAVDAQHSAGDQTDTAPPSSAADEAASQQTVAVDVEGTPTFGTAATSSSLFMPYAPSPSQQYSAQHADGSEAETQLLEVEVAVDEESKAAEQQESGTEQQARFQTSAELYVLPSAHDAASQDLTVPAFNYPPPSDSAAAWQPRKVFTLPTGVDLENQISQLRTHEQDALAQLRHTLLGSSGTPQGKQQYEPSSSSAAAEHPLTPAVSPAVASDKETSALGAVSTKSLPQAQQAAVAAAVGGGTRGTQGPRQGPSRRSWGTSGVPGAPTGPGRGPLPLAAIPVASTGGSQEASGALSKAALTGSSQAGVGSSSRSSDAGRLQAGMPLQGDGRGLNVPSPSPSRDQQAAPRLDARTFARMWSQQSLKERQRGNLPLGLRSSSSPAVSNIASAGAQGRTAYNGDSDVVGTSFAVEGDSIEAGEEGVAPLQRSKTIKELLAEAEAASSDEDMPQLPPALANVVQDIPSTAAAPRDTAQRSSSLTPNPAFQRPAQQQQGDLATTSTSAAQQQQPGRTRQPLRQMEASWAAAPAPAPNSLPALQQVPMQAVEGTSTDVGLSETQPSSEIERLPPKGTAAGASVPGERAPGGLLQRLASWAFSRKAQKFVTDSDDRTASSDDAGEVTGVVAADRGSSGMGSTSEVGLQGSNLRGGTFQESSVGRIRDCLPSLSVPPLPVSPVPAGPATAASPSVTGQSNWLSGNQSSPAAAPAAPLPGHQTARPPSPEAGSRIKLPTYRVQEAAGQAAASPPASLPRSRAPPQQSSGVTGSSIPYNSAPVSATAAAGAAGTAAEAPEASAQTDVVLPRRVPGSGGLRTKHGEYFSPKVRQRLTSNLNPQQDLATPKATANPPASSAASSSPPTRPTLSDWQRRGADEAARPYDKFVDSGKSPQYAARIIRYLGSPPGARSTAATMPQMPVLKPEYSRQPPASQRQRQEGQQVAKPNQAAAAAAQQEPGQAAAGTVTSSRGSYFNPAVLRSTQAAGQRQPGQPASAGSGAAQATTQSTGDMGYAQSAGQPSRFTQLASPRTNMAADTSNVAKLRLEQKLKLQRDRQQHPSADAL